MTGQHHASSNDAPSTDTSPHDVPSMVFDPQRLAAVDASRMVGSPPEQAFDRLASLAADLLEAPMAFVTAVDSERSWYKSFVGAPPGAQRWGPIEESFCQYVIGSGRECIFGDAREDDVAKWNPAIDKLGVVAWAGFPVRGPSGDVLGTLCVVDTQPRTWTERHRRILETLAAAASSEIALGAALRDERTHRERAEATAEELARTNAELARTASRAEALASTLSANLLPPRLEPLDGVDVGARFRSASAQTVTGDFYDLFRTGQGTPAVLIGDVVGKGPAAAAFASEIRYSVRAEAVHSSSPSAALTAVDRLLHSDAKAEEQFATAAYACMRRGSDHRWTIDLALAGHPQPLLRRADGTVTPVGAPGLPLGLFEAAERSETSLLLDPGDALLLYTDGVVEARREGEEFGDERLAAVLAAASVERADDVVAAVIDAVVGFTDGPGRDDMAAMALVAR